MNTYLIISETIYNINQKVKELTHNIDNIVSFNLDENSMDEILQEASYYSMFDDKKCIIVKNAKIFGTNKSSDTNKSKEDSEKLLKYLNDENKNTILIFTFNGKADTKKKIYNLIKNAGNLFLYTSISKTEMKNNVKALVLARKYQIEDNSLWYIINTTLGNFDLCINELEKIMIYYNKPCMIKYDDVVNLVSKNIEDNNFKLVDSIISRNLNNSLKLLNDFKIIKVEPSVIVSLLYREFKLMLSVLIYDKNKYSSSDIMKELNLANWQLDKIRGNLRLHNINEIKQEIVNLSKLDYKLKSGLIDKDTALTNYIIKFCDM